MMNAINSALVSALLLLSPPPPAQQCLDVCQVSPAGEATLRELEGFSPFVYKDSAGLDTIGIGHLIKPGEHFKEPLMGDAATQLFRTDIKPVETGVNRLVTVPLWQHQFDALVLFTYNVGLGRLRSSTLLRYVNAARHAEVPPQFMRWVYAGGRLVKGLLVPRRVEAKLYAGKSQAGAPPR